MVEQFLAVFGQAEPPRGAMEQAHAEMVLQLADQPGGGRMAGAGFAGHGGERPGLDHADEGAEGTQQFHDFPALRTDHVSYGRIIVNALASLFPVASAAEVNRA